MNTSTKKTTLLGLLFLICLCFPFTGLAQNFSSDFLEASKDASKKKLPSSFTVATVDPSTIEALKKEEKDPELLSFLNELTFLRVITIKKNTSSHCKKVTEMLKIKEFEILISITEEEQDVAIAAHKTSKDKAKEIVMLVCNSNMITIVNMTGDISISKLGNLSSAIKIQFKIN